MPTLSPEAVAATEALVPDWIENRPDLVWFLLNLKRIWPEASALFEGLAWVQDGIGNSPSGRDTLEVGVVSDFRDYWAFGPTGQEVVLGLLSKPWMQDNVSFEESNVVNYLEGAIRNSSGTANRLLEMPFLDSVDGHHEYRMVNLLSNMVWSDTSGLQTLLARPEFAGGITDDHAVELELISLEEYEPDAAAEIWALPWVQDGTDVSEWEKVDGLIDLVRTSDLFFGSAIDSLEVSDGISPDELSAMQSLYWAYILLQWEDLSATVALEGLPWILDGVDWSEWDGAVALMRLGDSNITAFWSAIEFEWVQDGISADEIEVIASLA